MPYKVASNAIPTHLIDREVAWEDDTSESINSKMKILLDFGQALMESGGDCARVVRDMTRAAVHIGIPTRYIQLHVTYTTIMLNVTDGKRSFTQFRKCRKHVTNLTSISALSKLSWRALIKNSPLPEVEEAVKAIVNRPMVYPSWVMALGAAVGSGGSCKLFGGTWLEAFITIICAFVGYVTNKTCIKNAFNPYATAGITAFVATLLAWMIPMLLGFDTMWYTLVACTIFLMPGFPLINAASDMLNKFTTAGMTRAVDTMLIVGGMTLGIAAAILIAGINDISTVKLQANDTYFNQALAAIMAAVGFSIMFNTPKRLLWIIAIEGIVTMLIRNVLMLDFGVSQAFASFFGAVVVGIAALKVIHLVHTPNTVLIIPPVIPLVPCVLLYRLLFAILNAQVVSVDGMLEAFRFGVAGATVIASIVVGVSMPNLFIQRRIEQDQQATIDRILRERAMGLTGK